MCSSFVAPFYISISVSTSYFLLSFLTPFCVSHFFCLAISVLSDETNWFPFCSSFPFLPKLLTYLTPIVHNIYLRFLYLHILFTEYCFASFFFLNKIREVSRKIIALNFHCVFTGSVCFLYVGSITLDGKKFRIHINDCKNLPVLA